MDKIESNLVNNVIQKPEEFGELSRKNTHFMISRHAPAGCITTFPLGSSQEKPYPRKDWSC